MVDMHVHSTFSPDGKSSMEEQVQRAIDLGISKLCFTDHVEFNDKEINLNRVKNKSVFNFDVDTYLNEIERLNRDYCEIEILSGIEFSEPHLFPNEFEYYCSCPFDCIIGAIHHCYNAVFPGARNLNERQAVCEYYDLMITSLQNTKFDVIAHLDFPRRYFDKWTIEEKLLETLLEAIVANHVVLEVNTSSCDEIEHEPLPHFDIIKRYSEMGGKYVTLGSDAHVSSRLAYTFSEIRSNLPKNIEVVYIKQRKVCRLERQIR